MKKVVRLKVRRINYLMLRIYLCFYDLAIPVFDIIQGGQLHKSTIILTNLNNFETYLIRENSWLLLNLLSVHFITKYGENVLFGDRYASIPQSHIDHRP
jgi:hypothetical protein